MAVAVNSTVELTKQEKPLTRQRRVVVTGTSVVTLLGHDSDVFYNNLLEGVLISEIEAFDCTQFPAIEVMETLDKAKCVKRLWHQVFYDAIDALRFSYKKVNPFSVPFTTTNMGSAMPCSQWIL
ncbi:hypothetical protein DVH24_018273 [Malus domestica]|uniref:beta-ketoacyl-[acyl-carrier-protein] synthase I n=1 Tax=Malus domestica TaxID=3750 RepID=A0A498KGA9_MALDO|nr:hypothetical protein DVH24_018273 [Malus domestica]